MKTTLLPALTGALLLTACASEPDPPPVVLQPAPVLSAYPKNEEFLAELDKHAELEGLSYDDKVLYLFFMLPAGEGFEERVARIREVVDRGE